MRSSAQSHRQPAYELAIETADLPEEVVRTAADYQHKMAEYLFEISCLDGLAQWTTGNALPSQFVKYFGKAIDLYDESVHYLIAHLRRQGFTIRCEPGCVSCCCHMPTGLTTPELIYLYHGMHRSGLFPRFFRRCLEAEEQWREIVMDYSHPPLCDMERGNIREAALKRYHRLEHYCPFLQQRRCQLYPYRPIACRMHFSLSSPHWCKPTHFQNEHAVRFNLEPGEKVFEALEHLEDCLQLRVSDIMVGGLLELGVNVMKLEKIDWIN